MFLMFSLFPAWLGGTDPQRWENILHKSQFVGFYIFKKETKNWPHAVFHVFLLSVDDI